MSASHINVETHDGVTVLAINDGKANALSTSLIEGIQAALDEVVETAKSLVIVGRPGKFCAGFDLKELTSGPDATVALVRRGGEMLMRLYGLPIPVVAACSGHAMAGGALLLLAADHRIGVPGAFKIGLNEVAIGLPLPGFAAALAEARLSPPWFTRAALCAEVFDPEGAKQAGYLDEVVAADTLVDAAIARARALGQMPASAFSATKASLRSALIDRVLGAMDDNLRGIAIGG